MGVIDHILLLQQIHHLIDSKSTGTPKAFAARLNISERTLFRIMEELKDRGAEITFNRERLTYYYQNDVEIKLLFRINVSGEFIKGGKCFDFYYPLPSLAVDTVNIAFDSY